MLLQTLMNFIRCEDTQGVKPRVYVGIDLGTTFSCVSLFNPATRQYEFLDFKNGDNPDTIPSVVYIEKDYVNNNVRMLVGAEAVAKNNSTTDTAASTNYFFGFKRLMGIQYEDKVVQEFARSVTYEVKEHQPQKGAQTIVVFPAYHSEKRPPTLYSPTDLSALVLGRIHSLITQSYEIISTVITTPAYFVVNQDSETRKAAMAAGFEKVNIFKEPTAACIEYAQTANLKLDTEEKILVFDLGGGTFDISIVEVENDQDNSDKKTNSNITVSKYVGDNFLGGENVNNYLFAEFMRIINKPLDKNERLRLRLFTEQFKIKACDLYKSGAIKARDVFIDGEGKKHDFTMTEAEFDKLAKPVYDRIHHLLFDNKEGLFRIDYNRQSLDKPIKQKDIQKIVMVGGSTRIPYIKRYLTKTFKNASIYDQIDADKSVAAGACKMCVNNDADSGEQTVMLLNATTLPIGIAVHDGSFKAIMEKDIVIPTEASEIFSTVEDNQARISLQVAMGVRPLFSQNHLIGSFELELKEPKPRGIPRIQVKVEMSADYKLTVTATDLDTNVTATKVFQESYVGTDKKLVTEILNAAKNTEVEDNETRAKLEQMRVFTGAVELYEKTFKDAKNLSEEQKLRFETTLQTFKEWLSENKEKATSEEIEAQVKMLEAESKELAEAIATSGEKKEDKQRDAL